MPWITTLALQLSFSLTYLLVSAPISLNIVYTKNIKKKKLCGGTGICPFQGGLQLDAQNGIL
jgi:hypothetical protein